MATLGPEFATEQKGSADSCFRTRDTSRGHLAAALGPEDVEALGRGAELRAAHDPGQEPAHAPLLRQGRPDAPLGEEHAHDAPEDDLERRGGVKEEERRSGGSRVRGRERKKVR